MKKLTLFSLALASLCFMGCSNGAMTLNPLKPNSSSSATRIYTPQGGGTVTSSGYNAAQALTYFAGTSNNSLLTNVTVAVNASNGAQVQISAPNVGTGASICVITGAQYSSDPCGTGSYFTDIGEERCGTLTNGVATFVMARSDFNIITVVLNSDLAQFTSWINGSNTSGGYPSMAQGQIAADMTYPSGVCGN